MVFQDYFLMETLTVREIGKRLGRLKRKGSVMTKIVWKSFKSNIKNFLAFFASVIMTVNVLFLFIYVQQSVAAIQVMDSSKLVFSIGGDLPRLFWSLIPEIMIVSVVVIVYSVRFYIRSRIKDYGMTSIIILARINI